VEGQLTLHALQTCGPSPPSRVKNPKGQRKQERREEKLRSDHVYRSDGDRHGLHLRPERYCPGSQPGSSL